MIFQDTNSLKPFVKEYFSENIKKYIVFRKEVIFFPKGCSQQMAELVCEHANSNKVEATLKSHKGVYKLIVKYLTPQSKKFTKTK